MIVRQKAIRMLGMSLTLACFVWAGARPAAGKWPQFRGPGGDGAAPKADPALHWSETKNVSWKTPIHGKGWSSPVIWDTTIWMTTATPDGKKLYAVGVDFKTGKILHDVLVFEVEKPQYCEPTNSYASCTPVIEEDRLYVHFGSSGTACLDAATGRVKWRRRDLPCNHWRGAGSSPILAGDLLIVALDGYDYQYVVALDKHSGKTIWKKPRDINYGTDNGDRKKAYSTAAVFEHKGRRQLVSPSAVATIAYNPATGEELWRVRHGGMNAAARPVYGHGLVFIAAGEVPHTLIAVRPDGKGDVTQTHVQWSMKKGAPKRPSQVLVDNWLFMINDRGVAACLEAKTGKTVWQKRIGGNYRASPIYAGGRIYFFSMEGRTSVIKAGPRFQQLTDNQLDNGFQASPAVIGNSLILRTTKHLYRIDK